MIDPEYKIIHISNEGHTSDSAHHTMYLRCMQAILGEFTLDPRKIYFAPNGLMRRHPTRETTSFTRDQLTPFLCYMIVPSYQTNEANAATISFVQRVLENGGFFFNTIRSNGETKPWYEVDWLDPQTRSLYKRAIGVRDYMRYVGDLNMLLNILYKDQFKPEHNADENIHMHLIASRLRYPTWIGRIAWNYYFNKTKKSWKQKVVDFFDRGGTYYPEIPPVAIAALTKLNEERQA